MARAHQVDFALDDIIEALVATGRIERGSAAYGVAQVVINKGIDCLPPFHRAVYDTEVAPLVAAAGAVSH